MNSLELKDIRLAIVINGSKKLGRCYYQYDYLVYSLDNVDDTNYDDVYTEDQKSYNRRKRLLDILPSSNAGCELGKFEHVPDTNLWVAKYYYREDSSD